MIARSDHVRLVRGDRRHLVVVLIKQHLINRVPICNCRIGEVSLDLFLQPVVRVRDITGLKACMSACSDNSN